MAFDPAPPRTLSAPRLSLSMLRAHLGPGLFVLPHLVMQMGWLFFVIAMLVIGYCTALAGAKLTAARRAVAKRYNEGFAGLPLRLPPLGAGETSPVFCLYVVRCERRDALAEHLKRHGIGTAVYYPAPVHRQPAYVKHPVTVPLPVSEKASAEVLALPMFPDLAPADQDRVIDAVRRFFAA